MSIPRNLFLSFLLLATLAIPAMADLTVDSPGNGNEVVSPVTLSANAATCSNQPVTSIGYSLDDSSETTIVKGTSVMAAVTSAVGLHTIHVKAWGNAGATCLSDVGIAVTPAAAMLVSDIQKLGTWAERNDSAVGGTSTGTSTFTNFGSTHQFNTRFSNYGAGLYFVSFGTDTSTNNFMYDGWVAFASPSTGVGNLEMDMNQVMANGQTVIFGFQCDGFSGTWDYTTNSGSPQSPVDEWIHSSAACNPRKWSTNAWHHVQISYSRDDNGIVTYNAVSLDGVVSNINATAPSAFALGWAPTLLTNFQIDGSSASGSSTAYLDDLSVYRW
jgi:hypothetical protein